MRLRIAMLIAACALAPQFDSRLAAQTLELTGDLPPPALPSPSFAASMVQLLEREAGELSASAAAEEADGDRAALVVRANLRLMAAELLARGDREGAAGSASIVNGLKIAIAREDFDRLVKERGGADDAGDRSRGVSDAIASFNRSAAEHVQRGGAESMEQWLAPLLARLTPLVTSAENGTLLSHWPAGQGATTAPAAPAAGDALALLRRRAEALAMDEATRATLLGAIDFLERGRQFPDLAPRIEPYRRTLALLVEVIETAMITRWLGEATRAALLSHASAAITDFADRERRERSMLAAERLAASRRAIIAADALVADNIEPRHMRTIMHNAEAAAEATQDAAKRLTQLAIALERMTAYRALEASGLARELRTIERDLARGYRESEAALLSRLADAALPLDAAADPDLASLVSDHRERLADLQRLRLVPDWSVAINQIYPPAAKDFDARMTRRARDLLEPSKRSTAILEMRRFEQELALFAPLPYEQALAEGQAQAQQLTGGQAQALHAAIVRDRRAWADDWSRVEPGPEPTQRMALLRRLTESLRDAAALTALQPEALNRWPAWRISGEVIDAGNSDVITRLRLACAAVANEDFSAVQEQVNRLEGESPLAKLAGRLMSVLGDDLRERPDGFAGMLAQLTQPTPEDAALLERRDDLALLCRYAAEAEHARSSGLDAPTREIQAYVNALATRLLEDIAGRREVD